MSQHSNASFALGAALIPALIASCASKSGTAGGPGTTGAGLRSEARLVLFTSGASTPRTMVRTGDSVFFKNDDPREFLQIQVDGDFVSSRDCETLQGFICMNHRAESRAVEPGGIVVLCFHAAGTFPVRAIRGMQTMETLVEVASR